MGRVVVLYGDGGDGGGEEGTLLLVERTRETWRTTQGERATRTRRRGGGERSETLQTEGNCLADGPRTHKLSVMAGDISPFFTAL